MSISDVDPSATMPDLLAGFQDRNRHRGRRFIFFKPTSISVPIPTPKLFCLGICFRSGRQVNEYYGVDYMQEICHQLWDRPQINWDGKVLGCCRNFWGDFGGNALMDGLLCSLNNTRIRYAREMLLGKREARADIPCTTCAIYLGMKENHRWLRRGLSWWCARAAGTAFRFCRRNLSRDSFRMLLPSQGGRGEVEHPRETLGKKGSGL